MFEYFDLSKPEVDLDNLSADDVAIEVDNLTLYFDQKRALHDIKMRIPRRQITSVIGPSGCGKSTLLGCFNRLNDLIPSCRIEGQVLMNGRNIYHRKEDVAALRSKVGMVFQKPNPFPMSVYDNLVYGLRVQGVKDRRTLDNAAEQALRDVALWREVKDRLFDSALTLSSGQQQRLVIARAIALQPEILLLDEPTSALDPISTLTIEELITQLKQKYTVLVVTHNMQQAARVSDFTAFLHNGHLIEYSDTNRLFTRPKEQQTEEYITGRFG
ncbi:phosphate ABC transporter ATP-binding protein PstB [Aliiglaciecola sp. CAU 1673]|uniref:phosphate ABC transporter ATP-binding protein PstB n=1 Tax=Aliiglaciecola sp. CAU 1673 TaxID=3032595 RepID=UPI0023DB73FB|nr:phosphate ABC transporter ATP-binding protein PstB [Aliiglaciecola sp. CAU 1673]MDF2179424.1 phosphate ABC transporter ATP-binding protein PstB [Aliiglaciecola sp. CAU 1673]